MRFHNRLDCTYKTGAASHVPPAKNAKLVRVEGRATRLKRPTGIAQNPFNRTKSFELTFCLKPQWNTCGKIYKRQGYHD